MTMDISAYPIIAVSAPLASAESPEGLLFLVRRDIAEDTSRFILSALEAILVILRPLHI